MKKALIFILAISFTYADIFDTYRYEGIKPAIELIEKQLQSKEFWLKKLQNKNVKLGYFENKSFILFCNKLSKNLDVYSYNNGKLAKIKTFTNLIVGKLGDKQKEGDLKTPIGNYTLINKIIPSNTFYGPLAFVTSYPNLFDKLHKKNGYGIWIHGKPLDGERGDLSKGCIVLENSDILYLNKIINYKNTILEITQTPLYAKKEDIASILATLYKWRWAWQNSDFDKYISFYAKDFHRSDGSDLESFKEYKKRVFKKRKNQNIKIFFKDIQITSYQNLKNLPIYKINFYEEYCAPDYTFKGKKEIYMTKKGDKFKIIIEK